MKHIVSFSGGKDSTAMLLMMLEKGMKVDYIVFVDTGKEFSQMYQHIHKVQDYIKREITVLKFDKPYDYWLGEHIKTKGKNKGKCGYGWPTPLARWCTALKRDLITRFLKGLNEEYQEYIGIASDEAKRCKNKIYPLVDWGVTEQQALEYCYSKGFDWGGLYEHFHRVSCFCCPLKSIPELKEIYSNYPEQWGIIKTMDNKAYNRFRADYSINDLEAKFNEKEAGEHARV